MTGIILIKISLNIKNNFISIISQKTLEKFNNLTQTKSSNPHFLFFKYQSLILVSYEK